MEIICENLNRTKQIANVVSDCVKQEGAFIALHGEIGAGKTTFTRFLLKSLGVKGSVTSPTFVLLNEYKNKNHIPVYHFDLYRLEKEGVKSIAAELQEYSKKGVLTLVEWADFAREELPKERIDIEIHCEDYVNEPDSRKFNFSATGDKMTQIVQNIEKELESKKCKF